MTHDEMRFLRREIIAYYLRENPTYIRIRVRTWEVFQFCQELKAYK